MAGLLDKYMTANPADEAAQRRKALASWARKWGEGVQGRVTNAAQLVRGLLDAGTWNRAATGLLGLDQTPEQRAGRVQDVANQFGQGMSPEEYDKTMNLALNINPVLSIKAKGGLLDAGRDSANIGVMDDFESIYKNAIEQDRHAHYGLRVIPRGHNVNPGDVLENSRAWDETGKVTEEMLPGVSTIGVDKDGLQAALERLKKAGYYGDQIALVKGDSAGTGQDAYERLLKNAEVVHALPYDFKTRKIGNPK